MKRSSLLRQTIDRSPLRHLIAAILRRMWNMSDCIFCKIVNGESPARVIYRDQQVTAFHDLHPAAPVHILVIPNKHIHSLNELAPEDESLVGHMFVVAAQLAREQGIHVNGYRSIINTGAHGGQTIFHLHLHLIGGGRMKHPMG